MSALLTSLQNLTNKFDSFQSTVNGKISSIESNYEQLATKINDLAHKQPASPIRADPNVSTGSFGNEELTRFTLKNESKNLLSQIPK